MLCLIRDKFDALKEQNPHLNVSSLFVSISSLLDTSVIKQSEPELMVDAECLVLSPFLNRTDELCSLLLFFNLFITLSESNVLDSR